MRDSVNLRAIRFFASLSPAYFLVLILKSIFTRVTPYFNIYFSAEIVTALSAEESSDRIISLVFVTLCGNFLIALCGAFLSHIFRHVSLQLTNREAVAFFDKHLHYPMPIWKITRFDSYDVKLQNLHGSEVLGKPVSCVLCLPSWMRFLTLYLHSYCS